MTSGLDVLREREELGACLVGCDLVMCDGFRDGCEG